MKEKTKTSAMTLEMAEKCQQQTTAKIYNFQTPKAKPRQTHAIKQSKVVYSKD